MIPAAKQTIPRGRRPLYISGWNHECDRLLESVEKAEHPEAMHSSAKELMDLLDKQRKERWEETIESIDFTHSCRKA